MPFGLKLRRTRRYNVLSKNCFVTRIRLLDSNVIECTLSVESTGQECLEAVAQRLELREVRAARPGPCVPGSWARLQFEPCWSRGWPDVSSSWSWDKQALIAWKLTAEPSVAALRALCNLKLLFLESREWYFLSRDAKGQVTVTFF